MALTAARFGGAEVVVTDSSEIALDLVARSRELNGIDQARLSTRKLDWHNHEPASALGHFELLFGSDVLFIGRNVDAVVSTIARCVVPGGLAVVLDPSRPSAEDFEQKCYTQPGFAVEVMEAKNLYVSGQRLLKRAVLYLVTVGSPSSRTTALRRGFLEAWSWLETAPTCEGLEYSYTEALLGT